MPVGKDCMMVMIRDKISLKFVTKMRVSKIIREEVSWNFDFSRVKHNFIELNRLAIIIIIFIIIIIIIMVMANLFVIGNVSMVRTY